jgi:hypothetical protein
MPDGITENLTEGVSAGAAGYGLKVAEERFDTGPRDTTSILISLGTMFLGMTAATAVIRGRTRQQIGTGLMLGSSGYLGQRLREFQTAGAGGAAQGAPRRPRVVGSGAPRASISSPNASRSTSRSESNSARTVSL